MTNYKQTGPFSFSHHSLRQSHPSVVRLIIVVAVDQAIMLERFINVNKYKNDPVKQRIPPSQISSSQDITQLQIVVTIHPLKRSLWREN